MENIKVIVDRSDLVAIADAVRDKTDATDGLTLGEIASSISNIDTCDLPTLTDGAAAGDIVSGKEAIDGSGNKITGTLPIKTANDLTTSGATVVVPSGYYQTQTSKSVTTTTQTTPIISVDAAGKITASATQTAGYVSAGTKSATKQLTTQAAKTVTPTKSNQTAVASGTYTTGVVTVGAIPDKYVDVSGVTASESDVMSGKTFGSGTSVKTGTFTIDSELTTQDNLISQIQTALQGKTAIGTSAPKLQNKTVSPSTSQQTVTPDFGYNGLSSVTVNAIPNTYVQPSATKATTTYTPGTSNQTIVAGTYCSGAQTILGDANLIASNIKSGVSIFGVTGTLTSASSGDGGDDDMGSGSATEGAIETVTLTYPGRPEPDAAIYYINGNMEMQQEEVVKGGTYTIAKNTIFLLTYCSNSFAGSTTIYSFGTQIIAAVAIGE